MGPTTHIWLKLRTAMLGTWYENGGFPQASVPEIGLNIPVWPKVWHSRWFTGWYGQNLTITYGCILTDTNPQWRLPVHNGQTDHSELFEAYISPLPTSSLTFSFLFSLSLSLFFSTYILKHLISLIDGSNDLWRRTMSSLMDLKR